MVADYKRKFFGGAENGKSESNGDAAREGGEKKAEKSSRWFDL